MVDLAEVQAVIKGILHLGPGYGVRFFAGVLSENVTVLAPLVTFIGDVPLKGEIFHRKLPLICTSLKSRGCISQAADKLRLFGRCAPTGCPGEAQENQGDHFLSPAPQALPQAVGLGSAAPQADGFSAGLSPAPQAEPQHEQCCPSQTDSSVP